jgi:hypothetical protein
MKRKHRLYLFSFFPIHERINLLHKKIKEMETRLINKNHKMWDKYEYIFLQFYKRSFLHTQKHTSIFLFTLFFSLRNCFLLQLLVLKNWNLGSQIRRHKFSPLLGSWIRRFHEIFRAPSYQISRM